MPQEVFIVLSMAFVANMSYWQLAPFYPKFVEDKDIDKMYVGFVMSAFALFFIISAFITGRFLLKRIERIQGCFIGAFFVIVNLVGLGMLDFLEDKRSIIQLSFFFQMIGGIGNGINTPSTIAVLSSHKAKRDLYIGYFEMCSGLGALFGPLLGVIFYHFGGYKAPFFFIGFFYLFMVGFFLRAYQKLQVVQNREPDFEYDSIERINLNI
mmetsp:Transcript_17557/g.29631  ORF Transcript_17557/g.29631 Transcript_17557/m.29631 type:complete len:210 (+) Transcript_17557:438-1067(+)